MLGLRLGPAGLRLAGALTGHGGERLHDDAPGQPSGRSQGAPSRYRRDERPRQRPDVDAVDDTDAVLCSLRSGEASFHHGWTLHSSRPNQSGDRRIGLNIQYLSPSVRQTLHDQ
ncbi:MAG: hypothetical protein DSY73_05705 [Actinobacteria bacterium]|nr:MAG: hypothetical protein DSY73_05705 [Actinomycetota bacterium]